ncbi:MAG: Gfo/Idh/MocA family oxidoreductase [Candidatus Poribacteria bacterium]|nr:Gfo/Idh/MocA family oxidoreductase [Candidatus Poribacteria bacterium]
MSDVKVGFVGTGGMANAHISQVDTIEEATIVAFCDIEEERAKVAADRYGGQYYTDARRLIDETEVDAIYFCLPPFAHTDIERLAADSGRHIFVEKPVSMTIDHGLSVLEAVNKNSVISGVGYQGRYQNSEIALRDYLKDKTIGMVVSHRWGGIAGGSDHWWRVMEKSGGMLHEQATHQVDMIRYLAGEITEVYKLSAMKINTDQPNHTIPDAEVVSLKFASGAVGQITTTCALTGGGGSMRTDFILEDHQIVQLGWGNFEIQPQNFDTIEISTDPQLGIDQAFIQAIQTNNQSLIKSSYADGLQSALVSICANQSSEEGKPVAVPQIVS